MNMIAIFSFYYISISNATNQ